MAKIEVGIGNSKQSLSEMRKIFVRFQKYYKIVHISIEIARENI
jgi:hypothetical protein